MMTSGLTMVLVVGLAVVLSAVIWLRRNAVKKLPHQCPVCMRKGRVATEVLNTWVGYRDHATE